MNKDLKLISKIWFAVYFICTAAGLISSAVIWTSAKQLDWVSSTIIMIIGTAIYAWITNKLKWKIFEIEEFKSTADASIDFMVKAPFYAFVLYFSAIFGAILVLIYVLISLFENSGGKEQ